MLADVPVGDDAADLLGYGDIADGLARLIEGEDTATPLTIAVSAPWGAGKTSLLRLVEDRVVRQRADRGVAPAIVVWFNAWMHDGAPSLSAAMAADVARHATRCRSFWMRLWHPLPASMLSPQERARRRFWLAAVALLLAVAIYPLVSFLVGPKQADETKVRATFGASAVAWFALFWGISVLCPRVQRSVAAVAAFVDDPRSAAATGSMTEVSAQLGELIREAQDGIRRAWGTEQQPRFVVIVDDLERCQPSKAVDVCEVAAQLLDHPGVITVLIGDLRIIAASAELKYRDAADKFSKDADFEVGGWGRAYLQKVVQFVLELPPVSQERLRGLRSALATGPAFASRADCSTRKPPLGRRLQSAGRNPLTAMALAPLTVTTLILLTMASFHPTGGHVVVPIILGIFGVCAMGALASLAWEDHRDRKIKNLRDELSRLVNDVILDVRTQPDGPPASADLEAEVIR